MYYIYHTLLIVLSILLFILHIHHKSRRGLVSLFNEVFIIIIINLIKERKI